MLSKINGATGAPKQEESNMQKNISLVFIAVMSFVISVLVMGFLNVYFDKNIAMLYVVISWVFVNVGLVKYNKVFGL
jgi:uncharacterized membrane protein